MLGGLHGDQIWKFVIFFFKYLKEKIFKRCSHTLPEIEERIVEEANATPRDVWVRTVQSFRDRLQRCVANNGHHLEDIIFKATWLLNGMFTANFKNKNLLSLNTLVIFL